MFALLARWFNKPPPEPRWLDADGLRARLADGTGPLVIDVRGAEEFAGPLGHIDGALNIPLPELDLRLGEIAGPGRPVVCVCLTDKRSAAAALTLAASGVANVSVLSGGMKAWREAGQ